MVDGMHTYMFIVTIVVIITICYACVIKIILTNLHLNTTEDQITQDSSSQSRQARICNEKMFASPGGSVIPGKLWE